MNPRFVPACMLGVALGCGVVTFSHAPSAGEPTHRGALEIDRRIVSSGTSLALSTTAVPSMSTVRWHHVAVPLGDGRVLVAGGHPTAESMTSADIFDPVKGTWAPAAPLAFANDWPVAAPMCDGRVFLAGAGGGGGTAEIYDPATEQWVSVGPMKYRHIYGRATLLKDCRILLSGGFDAKNFSEVFDPSTGTFKFGGAMSTSRFFHSATLLADGRVLAAGGGVDDFGIWYTYDFVDIWDPATSKWTKVKAMVDPRRAHTATLLPDGRVLVAGGTYGGKNDGTQGGTQLNTSEIYDPITNTWQKLAAKLVTARGLHTAALMPSGAVVLFGGLDATGSASREVEAYFQGTWQRLDPLLADRFGHASAQLADGSVLVTGGVHQATAEVYALGKLGDECATGLTCGSGICADGVCCNEVCGTGCRRCNTPGRAGTCSLPCAADDHALVCPDGSDTCPSDACAPAPCAPYRCDAEAGVCREGCKSVDDCAAGQACDLDGRCVSPPDISASDEAGCAASATSPAKSPTGPLAAWLAVALGVVIRSGRRRRS